MKEKLIFISCFVVVLVAACKKKDSPPVTPVENDINPVGVWSLVSTNNQRPNENNPTYTVGDHPCLSDNKLYFNADGTYQAKYVGTDTCFMYKTTMGYMIIGMPGNSHDGTWSQSGNTVMLNAFNTTDYATISTVNGVSKLVEKDTVSSSNTIITSIFEK